MKNNIDSIVSKNLSFLRTRLRLDILAFSEIIQTDPVLIWEIENKKTPGMENREKQIVILKAANYFAISLDVLLLDDIEGTGIADDDYIKSLVSEKDDGIIMSRKEFYRDVINYNIALNGQKHAEMDFYRTIAKLAHCLYNRDEKYWNLKIKGLVIRIDLNEQ